MIPKILYHGTTMTRWNNDIKHVGLKGNIPRRLTADEVHTGYLFFTTSPNQATSYALLSFEYDKQTMNPYYQEWNTDSRFGVILAVKTSIIKNGFELDPEGEKVKQKYIMEGVSKDDPGMKHYWYRYKGSIPSKYILLFRSFPIDHPNLAYIREQMRRTAEETKALDDFAKDL
jgi:hypothetical protein